MTTFTVEIAFYYDNQYTHSVWYNDVPEWRMQALRGREGTVYDTKWSKLVFVYNKQEVSE